MISIIDSYNNLTLYKFMKRTSTTQNGLLAGLALGSFVSATTSIDLIIGIGFGVGIGAFAGKIIELIARKT